MAVLSVQSPSLAGVAITHNAAAGGGDSFQNSGNVYIHVKNTSGGTLTPAVKVEGQGTDNFGVSGAGGTVFDQDVNLANNEEKVIGPFPPGRFNDANGRVQLTYPNGVTGVTVAVIAG
jgi:nicotinamide mononucleotide (NMN) deamidase PncC